MGNNTMSKFSDGLRNLEGTPMDTTGLTVALIQNVVEDRIELLLRYDEITRMWCFIVAERIGKESRREAMLREIAWQFDLDRNADFVVAHMAQLTVTSNEFLHGHPQTQPLEISFYPVHLYRKQVIDEIARRKGLRWISCREICEGQTDDGGTIDSRVVPWLRKWEVIRPWN
jgi:hypothetical protein